MGFVAQICRIIKSTVEKYGVMLEVEADEGFPKEARTIFPFGFESRPIDNKGDAGYMIPIGGSDGKTVFFGVLPASVDTEPGETRLYARDSEGNVVCEIRLYKDGKIRLQNDVSYIQTDKDGNIKIDSAGGTISMSDDGEILVFNTNGQFYLGSDGVLNVNGGNFTVDP